MSKGLRNNNQPLSSSGSSSSVADGVPSSAEATAASGVMPRARCTHCQTVFEISPEFLTSSDTRARCGECMSIFDVLSNLQYDDVSSEEGGNETSDADNAKQQVQSTENAAADENTAVTPPEPTPSPASTSGNSQSHVEAASAVDESQAETISADDTQVLDIKSSDFDLFSADANLPEVAYFDQTQDPELLRYNEPDGDETFSDTLFANDMTVDEPVSSQQDETLALTREALDTNVDFISDEVPSKTPAFVYRDGPRTPAATEAPQSDANAMPDFLQDVTAEPTRRFKWGLATTLALLLCVIAGGLYAFKERASLSQHPVLRPPLIKLCEVVGCVVPSRVDLDALRVLKRNVFSHPTISDSLVIDVSFVNDADFAQRHPTLNMRLTDINGGLVVRKTVPPEEYLDNWQDSDLLAAGERLNLSLTVEDPGQTAISFVLEFR